MEENNKNKSLDDFELLINNKNRQTFFKKRITLLIIVFLFIIYINLKLIYVVGLKSILICILVLLYFILIKNNNSKNEKENICEVGEEEKCLECNFTNNECSACNLGYKLINGKCIANFSFKATYYCNSDNKTITLIYSTYLKDIIEISLNNKTITISENYTFQYSGNYTFYFLMKIPSTNSLNNLFRRITNVTSIYFSNNFNTENITDISSMFDYCISLNSINIINLNTKNVINMQMLFFYCNELKSIELSNLNICTVFKHTTNICNILSIKII